MTKMISKREINKWLKKNLSVRARVCKAGYAYCTIGADASVDLHALAETIRVGVGAAKSDAWGLKSYLDLHFQ